MFIPVKRRNIHTWYISTLDLNPLRCSRWTSGLQQHQLSVARKRQAFTEDEATLHLAARSRTWQSIEILHAVRSFFIRSKAQQQQQQQQQDNHNHNNNNNNKNKNVKRHLCKSHPVVTWIWTSGLAIDAKSTTHLRKDLKTRSESLDLGDPIVILRLDNLFIFMWLPSSGHEVPFLKWCCCILQGAFFFSLSLSPSLPRVKRTSPVGSDVWLGHDGFHQFRSSM